MGYTMGKRDNGFTLVELLISMALALLIIAALSTAFITQQKTYNAQEQVAEMTQNARAAIDIMIREIRMSGYGIPKSATSNLSSLIDWVSGVTFSSGPIVVEADSGALGSDIIHIAGCFDGAVAILSADAAKDDTQIYIEPVDDNKSLSDLFNTDKKKMICIDSVENAIVTGVGSDSITINSGIAREYKSGSSICVVKVISYSIVQGDDGSSILKRNENLGAGRQPLAENIVDLQITKSGDTVEINPLTARTDRPDPNYSENNGYRTFDQRAYITPPNLKIK
jgi:prepilin-type N-terminal cleavage/methylation domain-containing protein